MIELIVIAFIVAVIIKWPLILWAVATISGVLGLVAKDVGKLMLAVFIGLLAWYLYGGIPFLN
jgi:hypothetical protein